MKIKEIHAGVKIAKNYNSYQASLVAELDDDENPETKGKELMKNALAIVNEELESFPKNEREVGAAWESKKSKNALSVKYSDKDEWEDVNIDDLEATEDGYLQRKNNRTLTFRKIPKARRKNDKMPLYRIYESGEGTNA